jgi:hypothetical protein
MERIEKVLRIMESTNVLVQITEALARNIHEQVPALSLPVCIDIAASLDCTPMVNYMLHAFDGLTDEELDTVCAFYDSAAGRKLMALLPQQMVALGEGLRRWQAGMREELQEKINAKLAAL